MDSIKELSQYLKDRESPIYDRTNYDNFLAKEKLLFDFPVIHVTGTNGKSSVVNFLKNIYKSNGYKVGSYISPVYKYTTEMISVNDVAITFEEVLNIFNSYKDKFDKYELTAFEIKTIIAMIYFKNSNLDIAIIEVGMGGEIDATNIIEEPFLSIITSISLEHTAYLGRTISEIARSKGDIIKYECPVLISKLEESAVETITDIARKRKSKVYSVAEPANVSIEDNKVKFTYGQYKDVVLDTPAIYQLSNAILAIEAVEILKEKLPICKENVIKGLGMSLLDARYFKKDNLIIDGAHNPEAIECLNRSVLKHTDKNVHVVFSAFKDKNVDLMLSFLARDFNNVYLTTFENNRVKTKDDYLFYLDTFPFYESYSELINKLLIEYPEDIILVTGSLAFALTVSNEFKRS